MTKIEQEPSPGIATARINSLGGSQTSAVTRAGAEMMADILEDHPDAEIDDVTVESISGQKKITLYFR